MLDALKRALGSTTAVASFAVVVDAKGEHVVRFYEKYGFMKLAANRYFLPMKTVRQLLRQHEQ